ncbi:N-methyl-L-tryptophan oxidase [Cohnella zeiphila]|uniref:N-methyl-L-tryptophan oxidase n=1 Tax=Cohnella zeiphila TaxID=2761120 RepID=A0A7X0VX82_9BACL|nr:N-methyl-L-tryptophan oxidase [Cohnella zeiphila]
MSGRTGYDVIVVGAGSMGMSAGYYLAKRGVRTLLIDAFDPPHSNGSHHGEPRLIRHAYEGGPQYVRLALRADVLWQELEQESGVKLLERSGVINMADPSVLSLSQRFRDAEEAGIRCERLDGEEVRRRWQGLRMPDGFEALYEPNAGYLFSERCVAAYRRLALAAGAELLVNTTVIRVTATRSQVTVRTTKGVYTAGCAILSAGAWFRTLAPFANLPVRAVRKVVGWFDAESETDAPLFQAGNFPGFTFGSTLGGYYGFPNIGGAGIKIGRHDGGQPWKPGDPFEPFGTYLEDEADLRRALEAFLPAAAGRLRKGLACKYELSPDGHFIVDAHADYSNVLMAGGFSGHGFKFASAVGEALSDWLTAGKRPADVVPFARSRFAEPAPVHTPEEAIR